MRIEAFHYKLDWPARGSRPGHHRSRQRGSGIEFRHHAGLLDAPDPRRFDLRASLRDPFGELKVRVYSQTSAVAVWAIADLSASLGFQNKLAVMAEFIACLSYSAYRSGDPFGFTGCDSAPRDEWLLTPRYDKAAGTVLADRLRRFTPTGSHAEGLVDAASLLGGRRCLVFLLSDFHLPLALVDQVLQALVYHQVVPVVLWHRAEFAALPRFGWVRVRDRETGRERSLLMRPALRAAIKQRFDQRRTALRSLFLRHGREPLWLAERFSVDEVSRYFYG